MAPLNEQPRDVGRSAVQESGCEKAYRIGKEKRIIKGRPFGVGFDRSHHYLQQGAPS